MQGNELILQAIESAKCRVYKLNFDLNRELSAHHQKKAENQKELMEVTVKALEMQIPMSPLDQSMRYRGTATGGKCPICRSSVNSKEYNYCRKCGQKLLWEGEEVEEY